MLWAISFEYFQYLDYSPRQVCAQCEKLLKCADGCRYSASSRELQVWKMLWRHGQNMSACRHDSLDGGRLPKKEVMRALIPKNSPFARFLLKTLQFKEAVPHLGVHHTSHMSGWDILNKLGTEDFFAFRATCQGRGGWLDRAVTVTGVEKFKINFRKWNNKRKFLL